MWLPLLLVITFLFPTVAFAQKEWHESDGPFHGLECGPDEVQVPIAQGVRCQKLPHCTHGTMLPGPYGFRCGATPDAIDDEPDVQNEADAMLQGRWYAYVELPTFDPDHKPITDLKTGKQGVDAICFVWQPGWIAVKDTKDWEYKNVTRWYTGWGWQINAVARTVTLADFEAPFVEDRADGKRYRMGEDIVSDLKVTVPLTRTRPSGCGDQWVAMWKEYNDHLGAPLAGEPSASGGGGGRPTPPMNALCFSDKGFARQNALGVCNPMRPR